MPIPSNEDISKMLKKYKKLSLISAIVLLGGIILWVIFSEHRVQWCKKEIAHVEQTLRKRGYKLSYEAIEYSGPFSFLTVHFKNVQLTTPTGGLEWSGEDVVISMRPWRILTVDVALSGKQTLRFPTKNQKSLEVLTLWGAKGSIALALPEYTYDNLVSEKLESVDLFIKHVAFAKSEVSQPIALKDLSLQATHLEHPLNAALSMKAQLQGIETLLGTTEETDHPLSLSFDALLSGFQEYSPFPRSLAEWRDGGGVLDIKRVQLDWTSVVVEGEGTFAFDEDMYPLASFSTQITGIDRLLKHIVALGWVKKKNAAIASFMLNMMGQKNDAGETIIKVPLTIQRRAVFVGGLPFPLIKNMDKLMAPST